MSGNYDLKLELDHWIGTELVVGIKVILFFGSVAIHAKCYICKCIYPAAELLIDRSDLGICEALVQFRVRILCNWLLWGIQLRKYCNYPPFDCCQTCWRSLYIYILLMYHITFPGGKSILSFINYYDVGLIGHLSVGRGWVRQRCWNRLRFGHLCKLTNSLLLIMSTIIPKLH